MKLGEHCKQCKNSLRCLSGSLDSLIGSTSLCPVHVAVFMWTDNDGYDVDPSNVTMAPPRRPNMNGDVMSISFLAPNKFASLLGETCNCEAAKKCPRLISLSVSGKFEDVVASLKMSHHVNKHEHVVSMGVKEDM